MRRSRFEIIGEILSLAINGTKKTSIVYRANLNFNVVNRYLDLLIQDGLISPTAGLERKFKTTKKGLEFLKAYENLKNVALGSSREREPWSSCRGRRPLQCQIHSPTAAISFGSWGARL